MKWFIIVPVALISMLPDVACAHEGRVDPHMWWRAWNWDPLTILSLALLAILYWRGIARLWMRTKPDYKVRPWQLAAFGGAWLVLALCLLSPLDAMADELSSLHMVQHMLLMFVAAPLLVLAAPLLTLAWGVTGWNILGGNWVLALLRSSNQQVWWYPLAGSLILAAVTWGWHHPILYQAALRDPLVHDVQHVSFFGAAFLFWRPFLSPDSSRRLTAPTATAYLFGTSVHASVLGIFMVLSPQVWYEDYLVRTTAWGFTPREDQQLAGLIMWMPACLIFPAVAAALFGIWLRDLTPASLQPSTKDRTV